MLQFFWSSDANAFPVILKKISINYKNHNRPIVKVIKT